MSNRSLTVVLPVYNGEARLAGCVEQLLELASELTPRFSILIVDDGSTDDTSTVARELSTRFPQVSVRRHRHRAGLGSIISSVRRRVSSDVVMIHDGVAPIDAMQVRRLWRQSVVVDGKPAVLVRCDVRELTQVRATHAAMATAHQRVIGFHLLAPQMRDEKATAQPAPSPATVHPPSKPTPTGRTGVGQIPPLPRPNFLSALAEFTLGE